MKVQLKSTDGTENLYPVTAANSVIFPDGNNLEAKFPELVGKSAYQSWLDAGHTGTEAEFVESLQGKDGKDGAQGNSGYTGAAGELEVVNNLTDGGATAALSAEQGKTMKHLYDVVHPEIETPTSDLDICDPNGNILVSFADGHVKTKNFDSSRASSSGSYNDYQKDNYFSVQVETSQVNKANLITSEGVNTYEASVVDTDYGVLHLPVSYTKTGTPTKLILFCKQGSSSITSSSSPVFNIGIFDYLRHLGYAVLAMDGVPDAWAARLGLSTDYLVNGNYIAVQSFIRGYEYVTKNWNIDKNGCYCWGYSQGGWCAFNVCEWSGLPIKACAMMSPLVSPRWNLFDGYFEGTDVGGTSFDYPHRVRIAKMFNYDSIPTTNAEATALEYDKDKISGYDPYYTNVVDPYESYVKNSNGKYVFPSGTDVDSISMKKYMDVPLKIWCAKNDSTLSPDLMRVVAKAIRNAGCVCALKYYTTGGHSIYSSQTAIATFTDENGNSQNIIPIAYEVAKWYQEFGGYSASLT